MGQRELHPLPNALDKEGKEGAPRHGRTHTAEGRAFHMLEAKQLISGSTPTVPTKKAYAGQHMGLRSRSDGSV